MIQVTSTIDIVNLHVLTAVNLMLLWKIHNSSSHHNHVPVLVFIIYCSFWAVCTIIKQHCEMYQIIFGLMVELDRDEKPFSSFVFFSFFFFLFF